MSELPSDAELVQQVLAGRDEAFGELVARYRDAVFGVAFHRLGDFEEARDVAQDAFLKAYLGLAELRDPAAFASWLYRIADGTAVDAARRTRREVPLAEAEEVIDSKAATAEQSDIARQVQQALAGLGEQSRLAVILHYVNGYTHAEIARFLGATPQAVKTRLSRARGKLREEMAEMVEEKLEEAAQDGTTRVYHFEAVPHGKPSILITGTTEATSPRELRQRLKRKGYTVTKVSRYLAPESEEAPIVRIVDVVLLQAVRDRAAAVRVEPQPEAEPKSMVILYLVEGVWREVMVTPMYVWDPLRQELADRADLRLRNDGRRQSGEISFTAEERSCVAKATFQQRVIRLDLAPSAPSTP